MTTFNIISLETGSKKGTVNGINLEDAENKCLEKNINIYDDYMLVQNLNEIIVGKRKQPIEDF